MYKHPAVAIPGAADKLQTMTLLIRANRLYYGWILVAALAVTELRSWGVQYYAFAVFLNNVFLLRTTGSGECGFNLATTAD